MWPLRKALFDALIWVNKISSSTHLIKAFQVSINEGPDRKNLREKSLL